MHICVNLQRSACVCAAPGMLLYATSASTLQYAFAVPSLLPASDDLAAIGLAVHQPTAVRCRVSLARFARLLSFHGYPTRNTHSDSAERVSVYATEGGEVCMSPK